MHRLIEVARRTVALLRRLLPWRGRSHRLYNPPMASKVIDGTALSNRTKEEVASRVQALKEKGRNVHLTAVLVGSTPAGELYAERQRQACAAVGIDYQLRTLPASADARAVAAALHALNRDPSVSGI